MILRKFFHSCATMTNQRRYESQYDDVEKCTMLTSWETHSIVVDSARSQKIALQSCARRQTYGAMHFIPLRAFCHTDAFMELP